MKVFILEDDEQRIKLFEEALAGHEVTIARSCGGPMGAYRKFQPPYDLILLDHDLDQRQMVSSDDEETGFQFVKFMGKAPEVNQPEVIIHSYNPDGAKAMHRLLDDNGWHLVLRMPFGPKLLNTLRESE
jgi:CheY-like chemotaxis protein